MPSNSPGKCPLCLKVMLVKNFKRHCKNCHNSIDSQEKYEKLLSKFKENIDSHCERPLAKKSKTSNKSSITISSEAVSITSTPITSDLSSTNESLPSPTVIERPPSQVAFEHSSSSNAAEDSSLSDTTESSPSANAAQHLSSSAEHYSSSNTDDRPPSLTVDDHLPSLKVDDHPPSSTVIILDDEASKDFFQSDTQIKNHICGEIRHVLKETELIHKIIDSASDENDNLKNFLIETKSYLVHIRESMDKLINSCDIAFEQVSVTSTTIDKLKSTETFVSRDPSITKEFNELELRYLVNLGPYQPLLAQYPVTEKLKESNDTCRFNSKWYKEFPLIEYSPLTDSIYCFSCRLFAGAPGTTQSERPWISTGIKAWDKIKGSRGAGKKGKIHIHNSSETHRTSIERYLTFKNRKNNVDFMLDKNLQHQEQKKIAEKKSNEEVIKLLIDCVRFLARQDLAFRGHTDEEGNFHQLVHLLSRHNPILKNWLENTNNRPYKVTYTSKDSQNELIELIGNCVQQRNLSDIRKASFFSVLADASIDSNREDMLSVFIRFVNENGIPEERFVSIKPLHSKTGDAIANHILEVLNELQLDINKLVAQSYDCANNMCGEANGVRAKISEKLQRDIKYIPCSSHRSNTVVKHGTETCLDLNCFFATLQSIYVFFTSSTKRLSVLCEEFSTNLFTLIPKTTTTIRWNGKYQSIRAVYESFREIITALEATVNDYNNFDKESRQQAKSISINMATFSFTTYLVFMKNLMSMTNSITTQLQAEQLDLITASELLGQTIKLLETERSNEKNLGNLILISEKLSSEYGVDPENEYNRKHRSRKRPKRFGGDPQTVHLSRVEYYQTKFQQVMDKLIMEYKELLRSIDENVQSLSKLSSKYIMEFTEKDAKNISSMIQINDSSLLYYEVQLVKVDLSGCDSIIDASVFVHNRKSSIPLLAKAFNYLLTMPVTVASVERSFSKMKIVKNRLRTRMDDERLYSLLSCTLETSILDELDNTEILEKWLNNKTGRRI